MTKLLEINNVSIRRGVLEVVQDVSLQLEKGEVVSVVGTNGAGKSSLMLATAGLLPISSGSIIFEGTDISTLSPHKRSHMGMALVPEGRALFSEMSVYENLKVGAYHRPLRKKLAQRMEYVFDLFPKLLERSPQIVSSLSGGEQQMVSIGRALMSSPRLLMLDEPSIGLAPVVMDQIYDVLGRVAADGQTILLVEQKVEESLRFSDRGYVLQNGSIALEGKAEDLLSNTDIATLYLGMERAAEA